MLKLARDINLQLRPSEMYKNILSIGHSAFKHKYGFSFGRYPAQGPDSIPLSYAIGLRR